MLGVNGAGALLRSGGVTVAKHVMKTIPQKALTKTLWYPILEKVLKIFGVSLTKGMGKVIPILGGVLSGGLTFAIMKPMGERLQKELSKLVNYNEGQYQIDIDTIRKEAEIIEGE